MRHCIFVAYLVESPDSREAQRRLGAGAEQLEDGHGGGQLPCRGPLHVDDGVGRLVDDHLGLVAQAALHKVKVRGARILHRKQNITSVCVR